MTPAELEAAFAALAAKKQRLRESFDRLAACSPVPIPFRWEDIDAHLSSVQSAIAARFRQHDTVSLRPAFAAGDPTTVAERVEHPVEHLAEEDPVPRVQPGVTEAAQGSNASDGDEVKNANFVQEAKKDKGNVDGAPEVRRVQQGGEMGNERGKLAIEASPEQDEASGVVMEATAESPREGGYEAKMADCDEAANASADDDEAEEEEGEAKWPSPRATAGGGGGEKAIARSIAAACANMDASTLVDTLFLYCRSSLLPARRAFLPALLGAADPHALVVRAVGEYLARPARMTYRSWGNCVALLDCLPHLTGTAGPSADTLEQAQLLALDWKEMMVGKTGSCRDISRLAGWGLFSFLASYNIVLEFEAEEIIRLFDNIPPDLKENCIELCRHLGLIEKMTDSIHHLVRNGQPLDAIRLACALNLTDECPLLSVMYDYVEMAKKTAEEILSKGSASAESLNQTMEKNVNSLILSWTAVDQWNIDSFHRNSIKEEISQLLHKYADMQQNLACVSAFVSTSHQEHNLEGQRQPQRTMAREENQQKQRKAQELQEKAGEKRQRPQHKTHKSQQKQLQNQEGRGRGWQNLTGRKPNKNQKRKQRRQNWRNPQPKWQQQQQQQFNKRPRFSSYSYSGIRGVPFADRATATPPQHRDSYDRSQPCSTNIPP